MRHQVSRCPICAQPTVPEYRPFCSKRCGNIDLGRWLGEHYTIPAGPWTGRNDDPEDDAGKD
jgi:endogenous inhibitor of DNA gyrase (YacG/DUF329 family)